jgi:hypothetical protein
MAGGIESTRRHPGPPNNTDARNPQRARYSRRFREQADDADDRILDARDAAVYPL